MFGKAGFLEEACSGCVLLDRIATRFLPIYERSEDFDHILDVFVFFSSSLVFQTFQYLRYIQNCYLM